MAFPVVLALDFGATVLVVVTLGIIIGGLVTRWVRKHYEP